jgi:septum formation protein
MALWLDKQPLVLGSRSSARRDMLTAAGIPVELRPADIDERAVEARAGQRDPAQAALLLAQEKALAASLLLPGRVVVGADQTLAVGTRRFSKPKDRTGAREQLQALAGQTHALHSCVAVARDGEVAFSHVDTARLTMRPLSDGFLDTYLDAVGPDAFASVGGYQLEKLGIHLFERIEGDHFTILGMPLLPLLAYLRDAGLLAK